MNIFFTSDTHFGHARIIELCDRPFKDVDHMNTEIVRRWNEVVMPTDIVYHLGDVALGRIDDSLPIVGRLNGLKIMVTGNHDRLFSDNKPAHRDRFQVEYAKVFNGGIISEEGAVLDTDPAFRLSHFPYAGDSHGTDRHADKRPVDDGMTLIHGHTHGKEKVTFTSKGTAQIHVGQDAWDFRPVSLETLLGLL